MYSHVQLHTEGGGKRAKHIRKHLFMVLFNAVGPPLLAGGTFGIFQL